MASVGSIVGGGFRLVTQRPVAVAIWAVVYIVFTLATRYLTMAMMNPASAEGLANPFAFLGTMLPLWIVSLVFYAVMMCGPYRAVLRPSEGGLGYLRLGMDEVRMIGLMLLVFVAAIILGVVVALVFGIVLGGMFAATGGGAVAVILGVVAWLASLCAMIYLWVRLSLIFSTSFYRRRIAIDEGWSLSRGHFWTLFGAYLIIAVAAIIVSAVTIWPFMSPYFMQMMAAMRNPEAMRELQAQQAEAQFNMPLATVILTSVLGAVVSALMLAVGGGATATATRELLLERGEVSEVDAESTAAIFE